MYVCELAHDTTCTSISEPKPDPHEVRERVMVRVVRDALEEVEIHTFGINLCKRDDEMGGGPALGLAREEGREVVLWARPTWGR